MDLTSYRPGMLLDGLPIRIGYLTSFNPTFLYLAQSFLIQHTDTLISLAILDLSTPSLHFQRIYRTLNLSSFVITRIFCLHIVTLWTLPALSPMFPVRRIRRLLPIVLAPCPCNTLILDRRRNYFSDYRKSHEWKKSNKVL